MYNSGACWRSEWHQGLCSGVAGECQLLQGFSPLKLPQTKQNIGDHNGFFMSQLPAHTHNPSEWADVAGYTLWSLHISPKQGKKMHN